MNPKSRQGGTSRCSSYSGKTRQRRRFRRGLLAQLARAPRLHRGGRGFEPLTTHQGKIPKFYLGIFRGWAVKQAKLLGLRGARTATAMSEFALKGQGEDREAGLRAFTVR